MSERKPPYLAKGKVRVNYVFPKGLAKKVIRMAGDEFTRPSYVAERLVAKGIEAEAKEAREKKAQAT